MNKAIALAWAQDKQDRKENLDKQIEKAKNWKVSDEHFDFLWHLKPKKLKAKEAEIIKEVLGKDPMKIDF